MSQAISSAPQQGQKNIVINILSGSQKGSRFQACLVLGKSLTVGRGDSNDIQLHGDPNISRQHFKISLEGGGLSMESLNTKNPVWAQGQPLQQTKIEGVAHFVVGQTELEITVVGNQNHQTSQFSQPPQPRRMTLPHQQAQAMPAFFQKKKKKQKALWVIVAVMGLLLFLGDKKKPVEPPQLRTEEDVNNEIATQKEVIKQLKEKNIKLGKSTIQFKTAQASYIKGFRDYKHGQYQRATQSFQACLSIYPPHTLCRRYLGLAQKRFSELVQYHMVLGKKSLDKKQYRACMTSFNNVMVMISDKSDKVFIEARSNYDICEYHDRKRF